MQIESHYFRGPVINLIQFMTHNIIRKKINWFTTFRQHVYSIGICSTWPSSRVNRHSLLLVYWALVITTEYPSEPLIDDDIYNCGKQKNYNFPSISSVKLKFTLCLLSTWNKLRFYRLSILVIVIIIFTNSHFWFISTECCG